MNTWSKILKKCICSFNEPVNFSKYENPSPYCQHIFNSTLHSERGNRYLEQFISPLKSQPKNLNHPVFCDLHSIHHRSLSRIRVPIQLPVRFPAVPATQQTDNVPLRHGARDQHLANQKTRESVFGSWWTSVQVYVLRPVLRLGRVCHDRLFVCERHGGDLCKDAIQVTKR